MHQLAMDVRSLSSGTMSLLMRQSKFNFPIDTSRYENIDRMQSALIAFTDSIVQAASDMRVAVPYESWQDLWQAFQKSRFFYDGLGIPQPDHGTSDTSYNFP